MSPPLLSLSGIVLLFTGISALGFAFAAVKMHEWCYRDVAYYACNGVGMLTSLTGALSLRHRFDRKAVRRAFWCGGLAALLFTAALVFGILETYHVYQVDETPNGGPLFFIACATALCSLLLNGILSVCAYNATGFDYSTAYSITSDPTSRNASYRAAGYPTSHGAGYPTSHGAGYPTSHSAGYLAEIPASPRSRHDVRSGR